MARDLKALGHRVIALDSSPRLADLARAADPSMTVLVADAAHLPFDDGSVDLAVAFMSLHDMDNMPGAIAEIARVLTRAGAACIAIVHPINSAGTFESDEPDARFVIDGSYFETRRTRDVLTREGLEMTFSSRHWPLEAYTRACEDAGLLIDALREVGVDDKSVQERPSQARWQRLPLFLHLRARKR